MKICLISATTASLAPIEKALKEVAPEVEYVHLLDSSLLKQLKEKGQIDEQITLRFDTLITLAVDAKCDGVLFTCSAFNDLANYFDEKFTIPIVRSDQGLINELLQYDNVGIVSTVKETPPVLISSLKKVRPDQIIKTVVEDGLIHLAEKGDFESHDKILQGHIDSLAEEVEVIGLSQFSIAHLKGQVQINKPIIDPAQTAVKEIIKRINESA
ncbi:aspartate/glutamate racemase family protein [Psychrobacillus soli]|uniref:Aspartate/glutamate racemase family protein n=1 Tax=Psychrobacillus soli TaxID=1543965 RepID=A0A544TN04_9BACI|nr:aspartate/glutamate racemase family protein [Psychrobacillus soli]TQR18833.1 hypothetical protein FG383_00690 [Psychrobacillus soli]